LRNQFGDPPLPALPPSSPPRAFPPSLNLLFLCKKLLISRMLPGELASRPMRKSRISSDINVEEYCSQICDEADSTSTVSPYDARTSKLDSFRGPPSSKIATSIVWDEEISTSRPYRRSTLSSDLGTSAEPSAGRKHASSTGICLGHTDFDSSPIKAHSFVATSQATIMATPVDIFAPKAPSDELSLCKVSVPLMEAVPADKGSESWTKARDRYVRSKEAKFRMQYHTLVKEVMKIVEALDDWDVHRTVLAHGSSMMFRLARIVHRIYSMLNNVASSLLVQRVPARHIDELKPYQCEGSESSSEQEDMEQIWMEVADRFLRKCVSALRQRTELLLETFELVDTMVKQEEADFDTGYLREKESDWTSYFARRADPNAFNTLVGYVVQCKDMIEEIRPDDASSQVVALRSSEFDKQIRVAYAPSLSSIVVLPEQWSIVSNTPIFRKEVDGVDLLHAICDYLKPVVFAENSLMIKSGTLGANMFFIQDGSCKVVADREVKAERKPGEFIGEISLIYTTERTADVIAEEQVEAFCLSRDSFDAIARKFPHVHQRIVDIGAQRVHKNKWSNRIEKFEDDIELFSNRQVVSSSCLDGSSLPADMQCFEYLVESIIAQLSKQQTACLDAEEVGGMLKELLSSFSSHQFEEGQTIVEAYEPHCAVFVVEQGGCFVRGRPSECIMGSSTVIGLIPLFFTGIPLNDVVAGSEGARVRTIKRSALIDLCNKRPLLQLALKAMASDQLQLCRKFPSVCNV